MGGLQHYLLLLVETVLDLGSYVISSEGYGPPRNVLVHLYADVEEDRVLRVLRESLGDPDAFVAIIRERFAEQLEG